MIILQVFKSESPSYLFNTIPNSNTERQTRIPGNISSFLLNMIILRILFFSFVITEWNKIGCCIG